MQKRAIVLINLGTPSSPDRRAVRKYLAEFLSDPRVITLAFPLRYALLYGFILPFRTRKTTRAYQEIWTTGGSPLRVNSLALMQALHAQLKHQYVVRFAMRYGEPSIKSVLQELQDCSEITLLPLFPQYANASTGSALAAALEYFHQSPLIPHLNVIASFYDHPAYLEAQASMIQPYLNDQDFVLFSYHGLPLNVSQPYGEQCQTTTKKLAHLLKLEPQQYDTSFQSRLGATPWIQPYTEERLIQLAAQGIKRLLVVCPSFTADCLETLEEIGMRAKEEWLALGGQSFTLVPALNADPKWVKSLIQIARLDTLEP